MEDSTKDSYGLSRISILFFYFYFVSVLKKKRRTNFFDFNRENDKKQILPVLGKKLEYFPKFHGQVHLFIFQKGELLIRTLFCLFLTFSKVIFKIIIISVVNICILYVKIIKTKKEILVKD